MKIALVVPHIFMHQQILPDVIFSPGKLALDLAHGLVERGHQVTLFTPGPVERYLQDTQIQNLTADLILFEQELAVRGDTYLDLLKKHPLTYISLARQVQSELVAQAYELANQGQLDVVHVWCNEEELALVNARFCKVPVVFNHHEPFNFLTRYRAIFPKYPNLNWTSFSYAQRETFGLPVEQVNWVGNVYHGLPVDQYQLETNPEDYLLYMGRIIQPKGVHYAIAAAKQAGKSLKIAGKHYAGHSKDKYWQEFVEPELDGDQIEYVGFVKDVEDKQALLGKAQALLMPSTWQEPFGLVAIEAMACGTPVIGFDRGSLPELVENGTNGWVVDYQEEEKAKKNGHIVNKNWQQLQKDQFFQFNLERLVSAINQINQLDRKKCRQKFVKRFELEKMADGYEALYQNLIKEK
jgi:glycosyltransferase involved in cell wall biosynthesis